MNDELKETTTDNIGGRARTAAGWRFLSKGISTGLQMVTSVVLARLLMPEAFGIVAMATMVTGLAEIFRQLGLGKALVQREQITEEHTRSAFWGTFLLSLLLYGLIYLVSPYVGEYFDEQRLIPVLKIIALTFVLSPIAVVPCALLQRELDFKTPFFAGLASSISYGAIGISMALLGYSYWALVGASLGGTILRTVALCVLTRYLPPIIPSFQGLGDLFNFGVGMTSVGLFGFIANKIDYFVIGRYRDAEDLGLYERAFKLINTPLSLTWTVCTIAFPVFSRLQNDRERGRSAFQRIAIIMTVFTWPIFAVLLVTAPEFIPLVFGEQWTPAVLPSQILMLAGFMRTVIDVGRNVAKAMGTRYVWGDAWRIAVFALLLGMGAWWASQRGIVEVAWAVVGATLIWLILTGHLLHAAIGFGLTHWSRGITASLMVTIAAGGSSFVLRNILFSADVSLWGTFIGAAMGGFLIAILIITFYPSAQLGVVRAEFSKAFQRVKQVVRP